MYCFIFVYFVLCSPLPAQPKKTMLILWRAFILRNIRHPAPTTPKRKKRTLATHLPRSCQQRCPGPRLANTAAGKDTHNENFTFCTRPTVGRRTCSTQNMKLNWNHCFNKHSTVCTNLCPSIVLIHGVLQEIDVCNIRKRQKSKIEMNVANHGCQPRLPTKPPTTKAQLLADVKLYFSLNLAPWHAPKRRAVQN